MLYRLQTHRNSQTMAASPTSAEFSGTADNSAGRGSESGVQRERVGFGEFSRLLRATGQHWHLPQECRLTLITLILQVRVVETLRTTSWLARAVLCL